MISLQRLSDCGRKKITIFHPSAFALFCPLQKTRTSTSIDTAPSRACGRGPALPPRREKTPTRRIPLIHDTEGTAPAGARWREEEATTRLLAVPPSQNKTQERTILVLALAKKGASQGPQ
jgi:hypothetical protein